MGSSPAPVNDHKIETKDDADAVWRDGVGPGFAVGTAESVAAVVGKAANKPYKAHR